MSGQRVAHIDYEVTQWIGNLRKNQTEVGLLKVINTELAVQTWTKMLWAFS